MKHDDGIIRVGGVGTGRIFNHAHLRAYPVFLGDTHMVGFYDTDPARAAGAKENYIKRLKEHAETHSTAAKLVDQNISELKVHKTLDSLLEQVDVIDICTHARGRMPSAIAAFNAGASAMSEKPMARTWSEVDRALRALAKNAGTTFQLNDDNAFEPKYRLIADIIARGELGKVQHITMIRGSHLGATSVLKAQATGLENGGGCLMDYGTHGMAGAFTIFGRDYHPVKVEALQIETLYPHRILEQEAFVMEVDDNAQIKVTMENEKTGATGIIFIEATWCGGHISVNEKKPGGQSGGVLEIICDKGVIGSYESNKFLIKPYSGGVTEIPVLEFEGETISVQSEMRSFWNSYRNQTEPELTLGFGGEIIAVCGAAYLSKLNGGGAVTLDEFKTYSKGFVEKYGDNEKADDAIVTELLSPFKRRN